MGKGGSTSSTVEVPQYIEDAARRNLTQADKISKLGFIPEYGPTVAAFTPLQEAAFQGTSELASAFGTPGGGMSQQDIVGGMPAPTTYDGGVRGYSSLPIYEQALEAFGQARPGQKRHAESFFIDPVTGLPGSNMQAPVDYTVTPTPGDLGGISAGGGDAPYFPPVTPPADPQVTPGPVFGGVPKLPTDGTVYTSTDFADNEVPYTIVTPTDVRPPGYVDNTPVTFPEVREYYDSSPLTSGGPAIMYSSDGTSTNLGFDLGPSVAGGRGTVVPGQATYTTQPTQEQLDYAATSLDPFGGAGPDVTSGPIAGLISGGGADGKGNLGQVGDFFGGIGDALGITDYSGQGGGLLSGLNVTGPVTTGSPAPAPAPAPTTFVNDYSDPATLAKFEADRAPGGIFYESAGSQRAEAAQRELIQSKDDALAQTVDTSAIKDLAKSKDASQEWLRDNGYGNYDRDDATDVLRSKVADIEKSQLKQGITDGVVMENDRYSVYVNGQLISSEKRSSDAKEKLKNATG